MARGALLLASLAAASVAEGPCDIYGAAGTPCVAAHSVVRALFGAYDGPLYQVQRAIDNATLDIGVIAPGGAANASAQDRFCAASACVISKIFDQSAQHNDLTPAPPGGNIHTADRPVNASAERLTLGGHPVYAVYSEKRNGYRIDNTTGVARGNDPEVIYMVTSGTHYNQHCCFDYGNAEVDNHDDGRGTMEAVYFGNNTAGAHPSGAGQGPWVMADLENGLWAGTTHPNNQNVPMNSTYVVAMVKGGSNGFALKGGDATQGKLITLYDGPRPSGYQPMKKQGSIILAIGGDNSDDSVGTFYEGLMLAGYSTDAADDAVMANIQAAGYGQ